MNSIVQKRGTARKGGNQASDGRRVGFVMKRKLEGFDIEMGEGQPNMLIALRVLWAMAFINLICVFLFFTQFISLTASKSPKIRSSFNPFALLTATFLNPEAKRVRAKLIRSLIALFILAVLIATCISLAISQKGIAPTIAIQKATPSGDDVLVAGQQVDFEIAVLARNVPKGSTSALVAQGADGVVLGTDGPRSLNEGETMKFHVSFKVPQTTSIEINTPLFLEGKDATKILDSRTYRVVGTLSP